MREKPVIWEWSKSQNVSRTPELDRSEDWTGYGEFYERPRVCGDVSVRAIA